VSWPAARGACPAGAVLRPLSAVSAEIRFHLLHRLLRLGGGRFDGGDADDGEGDELAGVVVAEGHVEASFGVGDHEGSHAGFGVGAGGERVHVLPIIQILLAVNNVSRFLFAPPRGRASRVAPDLKLYFVAAPVADNEEVDSMHQPAVAALHLVAFHLRLHHVSVLLLDVAHVAIAIDRAPSLPTQTNRRDRALAPL